MQMFAVESGNISAAASSEISSLIIYLQIKRTSWTLATLTTDIWNAE